MFSGLDFSNSGYKFLWDGDLKVEPYSGRIKKYHCGRELLLLEEEYTGETVVICTMDANECTLARVGKNFEVLWHKESFVPRKHDAGGQSQRRFERGRDQALIQWLKECSVAIRLNIKGHNLVLAGPADTKLRLQKFLTKSVRIISVVDVGYTTEAGIWEALEKAGDDIKNLQIMEEKKLGDEFARLLNVKPDIVDYGEQFDRSNAKLVLVTEEYEDSFPGLDVRVVRHHIVRALKVCVFKQY